MGWISPTAYSDPNGKWSNEANAYDGNLGTWAVGQYGTTAVLSLGGVGTIFCYKIRIYCSESPVSDDVTDVEVYSGSWIRWSGTIPALTWFEIEFNSFVKLTSVEIRRISGGNWRIYELELWSGVDGYQSPAAEDYIVANENVITDALKNPQQRKLVIGPDDRVHCVFRKCVYGGNIWKVNYAYSDDYGRTWTIEDPTPGMTTYTQNSPSIAVDSSGNPHIVFYDFPSTAHGLIHTGRYVRRSAGGTWTLSNLYYGSAIASVDAPTPYPFNFKAGDEVWGQISGVKKIISYVPGTRGGVFSFLGGGSGLIYDEFINFETSKGRYLGERGPSADTAVSMRPSDRLAVVAYAGAKTWYWVQNSPGGSFPHAGAPIGTGQGVTLDVDPSGSTKVVYLNVNSYYDAAGDTLICTGTHPSAHINACFSVASDSNGDVHFVLAQTGLGGDFPSLLNIKYYKRIDLSWFGPTHITDVSYEQRYPSISTDSQGRIHVMWQGTGWGTYPQRKSVLMRTYENGAWGATQIILNEGKDQGAFGASLLHAWHPISNRRSAPIYIFARQDSMKIQFGGDIYAVGAPDNLLCEQTKNPTNVSDPNPEFSAVYHYG